MTANNSETGLGIDKIKADFKKLMNMDVLVGVPEDETLRTDDTTVNNAQLIYLHTNGSDLQHIPERPIIEPAIQAHRDEINKLLKVVGELALAGKTDQALKQLKKVGMYGQNVCLDWFTDPRNNWPPNSEKTVLAKLRKSTNPTLKAAVKFVDEGGDLANIAGIEGATQVLIDTGQMRRAITYKIREKNK